MRQAFGASFEVSPGYLNTASIGVPPSTVVDEVGAALERWRRGADLPEAFEQAVESGRRDFARLVGVEAATVAIGATTSQLLGQVAAGVPDGTKVLTLEREYTSVTFPFAVQRARGVTVTEVPREELYDRVRGFDVVAVTVAQSSDGWVVDLGELRRAAEAAGTMVVLDATQAAGWLPLHLDWVDFVAAHGYKWLLSPRGASWLAVHPRALERGLPTAAGWYAAPPDADPAYGLPLRLRPDARRYDLSPAWHSQIGAAAALAYLAGLDLEAVRRHATGLADQVLTGLGLEPRGQAIIALDVDPERLRRAGVVAAARAGRTRLSFHLYNTREDVDLVLSALGT